MSESQYNAILFVIVTVFACAVAGAALSMCGCGGSEFTLKDVREPDAALVDSPSIVIDVALDARKSSSETASPGVDAMNISDAELVESTIMTKDAEVEAEAATCDLGKCPTCPAGNGKCCIAGSCGCYDFGPACLRSQ